MPPSSKPLETDVSRVFWRSFLLVFLVRELMVWHWVQGLRMPMPPGHRVLLFLFARFGTRQSVFLALLLGGVFTLLVILVVRLIVRPALNLWLRPTVDPSGWMFHLAASESPVASVPGRRKSGSRWQPGALVLTNRRLWFFPAGWYVEPWSLAHGDVSRIEPEPVRLAKLAPIRNWPDQLRLSSRTGEESTFAVADPDAVLAWFGPAQRRDDTLLTFRIAPQGAFDV